MNDTLVDRIDALLPQTQCTRCGYEACRPYAEAIAAGAPINQCPPGGAAGIARLAQLLGQRILPLNPDNGVDKALAVALIDEARCIGCTLCIQACPVDAIVGRAKLMHTVLAADCTGCELCVPPCPMDCIAMVPVEPARTWTQADADAARANYFARNARLAADDRRDQLPSDDASKKEAVVQAAIERARARRTRPAGQGEPRHDR